ncbi:uncharacterized protein BO95DRAFT_517246 [Aspergillus brunneoviolaceus CBS 621.78]|uniref:Uncharacterized protein n=1 Tax=Aspergillus brunneoviolaceus CBS 621.78 TaxID=1450534 RepID=A0ACD1FZI5_9EURO|nr:hypothetical protein BO95DRAFT_517246 [Aspergillus brunneoviolaceus CBS 621.78]RAH42362.1 hypothetical protein BO95DRAFT_517246 [Aspergillus brunneoviolaceus CBS 621.78]
MANGYARMPGEVNASYNSRKISQTTLYPEAIPAKKRASSFYPVRGPGIVDESNPDPFYLEHTLAEGGPWGPGRPHSRDARHSDEASQYLMLGSLHNNKGGPFAISSRGDTTRFRSNVNRSTLSVVELEHQLSLREITANQPWGGKFPSYDQSSFSSVRTDATPDLTPSSSFSSNYSALTNRETITSGSEYQSLLNQQAPPSPRRQVYPASSTPANLSQTTLTTEPSTPTRSLKTLAGPSNASTDTLVMQRVSSHDPASTRGKPLPSLPNGIRNRNSKPGKKGPPPALRPPIAPSMISPPCWYNPVTKEPHVSHFDQAMFISGNDRPSPVPSPGPASPSVERHPMAKRPATSPAGMICQHEQSVWESDSDSESVDPRSLSRKPMDTLKKVRSRVHLRVAKSAPKLNNTQGQSQHAQGLERFPSTPDPPPELLCPSPMRDLIRSRSKDILRPTAQQTLRLVAPSTTSLVQPRSRRNSNGAVNIDMDRTTAAAMQAKSRRRQRSDSSPKVLTEAEKLCTLCREDRSDRAIHQSLTLARPPLYKRVWESLRVLGCHGDLPPPRPRRPM